MASELNDLLTEFEFLEYKVSFSTPQLLIEDYDLALQTDIKLGEQKSILELLRNAVQMAAHLTTSDSTQFASQLLGRLTEESLRQELLEQARHRNLGVWLRPISPSLTTPDQPLSRTLVGHEGGESTL